MTLGAVRSKQTGVGLIEVMVTFLLLSTSLLALAALQNRSLQYNHEAYLRSQANILAYDILDRVRINATGLSQYQLELGDEAPSGSNAGARDLREWKTAVTTALPDGEAEIRCSGVTRVCSVAIRWREGDGADVDGEDDERTTTFRYSALL